MVKFFKYLQLLVVSACLCIHENELTLEKSVLLSPEHIWLVLQL